MKQLTQYKKGCKPAIYIVCAMLLLSACTKDLLEPVPLNSLSDATAFSTADKILAGVNNLYAQLLNASYYGGRYIVFQEQRGDEFSQNDGNNSTGANVWNQTITSSGNFVNAVWSAAYRTINSANILMANLENSTVVSEELRKNYIGEAKFVRAFCYHSLVQTYASPYLQDKTAAALPLRLEPETTGTNNNMAFSTVEDIYTQILKDLDEAETDLPASYSTALLHVSRAKKSSAIALKTRVYLTKGDYDKVMTEAAKIVPASAPYTFTAGTTVHALDADISRVFSGTYTGTESIFTLPIVGANEAPGSQSALAYNYLYPILYMNPAAIAADPVFASTSADARYKLTKKNAAGQLLLNKFAKNTVPYTDYIPAIRYAEILLNYAEAAASKDDLARGLDLLNAVRKRSDAGYTFPAGSVSTKEALISTIITERRIELLGEGFRTVDLLRRVQTLPAKSGNAGTAPAVAPGALNYVWAIPSDELSYNSLAPR